MSVWGVEPYAKCVQVSHRRTAVRFPRVPMKNIRGGILNVEVEEKKAEKSHMDDA